MSTSKKHHQYLQRCVALAERALAEGNDPFGSLLVSAKGEVLFEDYNHSAGGNKMLHPELAIAVWAAANLNEAERAEAVVYTSGEHCAMCAAAHAWVGLGKIVYASSTDQLGQWLTEFGAERPPIAPIRITEVAPAIETEGPFHEFADTMRELHRKNSLRHK